MAKKIKIKTHSGAKKRFNISKNGKVKYQKTNRRHRLTQKATKRKRINRIVCTVHLASGIDSCDPELSEISLL